MDALSFAMFNNKLNDVSASNYFDIGSMRIQWGTVASGTAGAQTITLPAAFADTSYVITGNMMYDNAQWLFSLAVEPLTTTTFKVVKMYGGTNIVDGASQGFNWIAIGIKP